MAKVGENYASPREKQNEKEREMRGERDSQEEVYE
jgi:hypothetical protein